MILGLILEFPHGSEDSVSTKVLYVHKYYLCLVNTCKYVFVFALSKYYWYLGILSVERELLPLVRFFPVEENQKPFILIILYVAFLRIDNGLQNLIPMR